MEQNFQTSFIPKKPMIPESVTVARPVSILLIISLFILFTVLIATGGLYLYKGSINKSIITMQDSLQKAQARFEPSAISKLQVLDKRLDASSQILGNHLSITPIFSALEALTMKSVRYTNFSYDLGTDKNPTVNVKMSGIAIGYRSVALQSDLFAQNKNIIDPVFSNLTLDNSGNVIFDLEFSVDPAFVNYKQNFLTTQS